ncbi:hypothetical protein [Hamadaea tsunoensis]|uniref:hypothetical protein n=1 Tax=Hamadaea tsunoensis TaxID=53368 RepID=UPI0004260C3C|nr:hypothetical protein [Hamadaea tsunoensis]
METSLETPIAQADPPAFTIGALPVERSARESGVRNPMRALRLPEEDDPAPHSGRLVVVCAWAAAIAMLGLVIALRTLFALLHSPGADWVVPTIVVLGAAGTVSAGLSFATIHHKWLPWQLLAVSTTLLLANLVLVAGQF